MYQLCGSVFFPSVCEDLLGYHKHEHALNLKTRQMVPVGMAQGCGPLPLSSKWGAFIDMAKQALPTTHII